MRDIYLIIKLSYDFAIKFEAKARRMIRMDKLIQVFYDTQKFYTTDNDLKEALKFSIEHTRIYRPDEYPDLPDISEKLGLTLVLNLRSFQAAMKFHRVMPNKKIAVLNFASEIKPGGGVLKGSTAQEEALCRCSTLYPTLNQDWLKKSYYFPNQAHRDYRNDDTCIYSEKIIICKTDTATPERLSHEDFVPVDVITCAAPNLRHIDAEAINFSELSELHVKRAKHILHIASANGVDILVTGAFGCGAFKNEPKIVAEAWKEALKTYQKKFDYIIFAVFFRNRESDNFKVFNEKFS